eukprot:SAG22_NODE_4161_length_1362_cov_19.376880_2_plen_64_part_00
MYSNPDGWGSWLGAGAMSAATVEALRADYKLLYGHHARGSKCMDATWLRARIKAKGVPGPAGP